MSLFYIGTAGIVLWMFMYIAGLIRHDDREIVGKLSWFNVIGLTFLSVIGQKYDGCCREDKEEYIAKCAAAAWTLTLLPISFIIAAIFCKGYSCIFIIILSFIPMIYIVDDIHDKGRKRKAEIEYTLPRVVTKMALLIKAGMNVNDAWNSVADAGDGVLYELMKEVSGKLASSVPEHDAYKDFIRSCDVPMIERFISNISRNRIFGNAGLETSLSEMSTELWSERVHKAEVESVNTANKLMIPSMLIFIGILIIVSAPMLISLGT